MFTEGLGCVGVNQSALIQGGEKNIKAAKALWCLTHVLAPPFEGQGPTPIEPPLNRNKPFARPKVWALEKSG